LSFFVQFDPKVKSVKNYEKAAINGILHLFDVAGELELLPATDRPRKSK